MKLSFDIYEFDELSKKSQKRAMRRYLMDHERDPWYEDDAPSDFSNDVEDAIEAIFADKFDVGFSQIRFNRKEGKVLAIITKPLSQLRHKIEASHVADDSLLPLYQTFEEVQTKVCIVIAKDNQVKACVKIKRVKVAIDKLSLLGEYITDYVLSFVEEIDEVIKERTKNFIRLYKKGIAAEIKERDHLFLKDGTKLPLSRIFVQKKLSTE